jgi:hypothetical protein
LKKKGENRLHESGRLHLKERKERKERKEEKDEEALKSNRKGRDRESGGRHSHVRHGEDFKARDACKVAGAELIGSRQLG